MLGNTGLVPTPHLLAGPLLGVRQYVTTAIKMQPITIQPSDGSRRGVPSL